MNVLHISSEMAWRGGEQQLAYLIEGVSEDKMPHYVLCAEGSALHTYCKKNGIKHSTFSKGIIAQFSAANQTKKICRAEKIDLIHIHDSHAHNIAILAADFYGNKCPLVLSRKVIFPISGNVFSRYKYNHKQIKKIICVSNAAREVLSRDLKDKSKLCVVYDAVAINSFALAKGNSLREKYRINENELLIGNIAALTSEKDYPTFINTAEILVRKGIQARFVIIGDGDQKPTLVKLVEDKKLSDKIIFYGFANKVPALLKELDLLLFTSKQEGLGSIVLGAFAAGVPVVATSAGGVPEIVKHDQTGLLAPVGDANQLAQHVMRIMESDQLKQELIKNAFSFVQDFSVENYTRRMMAVYEDVISL